jgi:hypothetical protein
MGFTTTEPQNHQSENTWFTPKCFIDTLGPFDLDPCTVSYRPFNTAANSIEYDKGICGIKENWIGDVWLNPPYGKEIGPFIEKFMRHRQGIMLIFARMGSEGIQRLIKDGAIFFFLRKRVKFISKQNIQNTNAGVDSCLVFYDKKYITKVNFFDGVLFEQRRKEFVK